MSSWINIDAVLHILIFGLLIGAALPGTFAIGVRLYAEGSGIVAHDGQTVSRPNPALVTLAWALFSLVFIAVVVGVLFIARDFIGHQTGLYILGAKPK